VPAGDHRENLAAGRDVREPFDAMLAFAFVLAPLALAPFGLARRGDDELVPFLDRRERVDSDLLTRCDRESDRSRPLDGLVRA
jgi:hypothetical protein